MTDDDGRWAVARVALRGRAPGATGPTWEVLGPKIYRSFAEALAFARQLDEAEVYALELVQVIHRGQPEVVR